MKKTALMEEAIKAFRERKGELPADAGYPVVREKVEEVYFARSVEDWHDFVRGQHLYASLVWVVLISTLAAIATIITGLMMSASALVVVSICTFCLVMPMVYMAVVLKITSKPVADLYVYCGERKKFYAIGRHDVG